MFCYQLSDVSWQWGRILYFQGTLNFQIFLSTGYYMPSSIYMWKNLWLTWIKYDQSFYESASMTTKKSTLNEGIHFLVWNIWDPHRNETNPFRFKFPLKKKLGKLCPGTFWKRWASNEAKLKRAIWVKNFLNRHLGRHGCSRRMGPWDDGTQNRNYPTFDRSMIDSATLQFVAPRKLACIIPPWRTCCSRTNVKSFDTAPGVVWNSCVVFRKKLMYYSTFSTSCHPHKRFCWWRLQ